MLTYMMISAHHVPSMGKTPM